MNVSEKFGDLGIVPDKETLRFPPERLLEITSPEAMMQYGEEVKKRVRIEAIGIKQDTSEELNDVYTATKLPEQALYFLRRQFDVDGKIQQSFERVDSLVRTTEQEISAATTAH